MIRRDSWMAFPKAPGAVACICLALLAGLATAPNVTATSPNPGSQLEITEFSMHTEQAEGVPYVFRQAGGHPWALTFRLKVASELVFLAFGNKSGGEFVEVPTRDIKDVVVNLPDGLLLNPNPRLFPRCPRQQVLAGVICPVDTQVGVARLHFLSGNTSLGPIVNVTPEEGQSAEFGIETPFNVNALLTGHVVRKGASYGLAGVSNSIPMAEITEVETTFWGVPADPSHDVMRGRFCQVELQECLNGKPISSGQPPTAFVTMPTNCGSRGLTAAVQADSWEEPGRFVTPPPAVLPGMTGCNLLSFQPTIQVRPDTPLADAPVSLGVDLSVPQAESPTTLATPQVRDSLVKLPTGLSISPGIVDGIEACEESGPEGINFEGQLSEERGPNGEPELAPGRCPDASVVGTARAFSPLLDVPVEGHIYLAKPHCGGLGERRCTEQDAADGELYQLYLELGGTGELANTGVNLKVRGEVRANPATGQLTAVFANTPQLPFSKLEVHLNGGPRAPMDNPWTCGNAVTTTDFTPWSAPISEEGVAVAGSPDATPSSSYDVAGCGNPPVFRPAFLAGNVTSQAGQFSAFTLSLSRKDREQYITGLRVHTPVGLLGMLSNVPLCGAGDAEGGTCPASSKIGTTRVASGAGSHPFEIEGDVYLTGPYRGAPFGLSVVTHAVAGPFDLGLVVVRAKIDIDSSTSRLLVTTDETGPHALPQILFGVPLRLQRIIVNIDRAKFMFNPTNCKPLRIEADVGGSQRTIVNVATPFAVVGCRSLAFKPAFSATTNGHTSRAKGASLDVKLSYPRGSFGRSANIVRTKVSLPRQLPSRLSTLQKACPSATFELNPASCPSASVVGVVRATTPVLPVRLAGPVYFVSHGGEAFPSLVIVLEGDGVRVDLTGTTFISKAGITSSTFDDLPDVPVNSFELFLPQGKLSALAANGALCAAKARLIMPTELVAQNGAVIHQRTRIKVAGCAIRGRSSRRRASHGMHGRRK